MLTFTPLSIRAGVQKKDATTIETGLPTLAAEEPPVACPPALSALTIKISSLVHKSNEERKPVIEIEETSTAGPSSSSTCTRSSQDSASSSTSATSSEGPDPGPSSSEKPSSASEKLPVDDDESEAEGDQPLKGLAGVFFNGPEFEDGSSSFWRSMRTRYERSQEKEDLRSEIEEARRGLDGRWPAKEVQERE